MMLPVLNSRSTYPRIQQVVEQDMCIACGACVYACPQDVVVPTYNSLRAAHEIRIADKTYCPTCAAPCDAVCPSIQVDLVGLLPDARNGDGAIDRHGVVQSVHIGYAPAHQFNGVSSSGGVLRCFVSHALETGTPVVCLGQVGDDYEPMIARSLADLQRVPGSIYHSVSFAKCITVLRALDEPCVLVSIPCHLEGILTYIRKHEPALEEKIALNVGLICGWMYSGHGIRAFAHHKALPGRVVDAAYRGEDKVGLLKLKTDLGVYRFSRRSFSGLGGELDYKSSFSGVVNRLRCRLCENHLNVLADVVVGDAWLKRKPKATDKLSIVVTRTDRGSAALNKLVTMRKVVLEEGTIEDIEESQSYNLIHGVVAGKLNRFLQERGRLTPQFDYGDGPRHTSLTVAERIDFGFEIALRRLLRSGQYRAYRAMYVLFRWRLFGGKVKARVFRFCKKRYRRTLEFIGERFGRGG